MIFTFLEFFAHVDDSCKKSFLGIQPWYKYLHVHQNNECAPQLNGINEIWLIGLALIEILLRIAALMAIAFVVFAGIKYSASRGNSDKVTSAKNTLLDALTGLVIAIVAIAAVSFIGGRFGQS